MIFRCTAWPDNASLIADVTDLGYVKGAVLDPTYGRGGWWKRRRPENLVARDRKSHSDWDFRTMVEFEDETFDTVAFDPPYVCASLDTEILTRRGWLKSTEVTTDDVAYTLNVVTGLGEWAPVERVIQLGPSPRRLLSMEAKAHSSLTTLEHRWPVQERVRLNGQRGYRPAWRTSASFKADDLVPIAARHAGQPMLPVHSDALVELVAWYWTEGHVEGGQAGDTGRGAYGNITQSHVVNSDNCRRIERALEAVFGPASDHFPRLGRTTDGIPRWRRSLDDDKFVYWLSADAARVLLRLAPNRVPALGFLESLTPEQLDLFIQTSIDGDGHRRVANGATTLAQKVLAMAESFQVACILAGHATSLHFGTSGHTVRVRKRATFKPSRSHPTIVESSEPVWCVTTRNETWLARRNGSVYFTGNCTGGRKTIGAQAKDFTDRYGMVDAASSPAAVQSDINDGLAQAYRVLRPGGYLLVKCSDYVSSGELWPGTHFTWTWACVQLPFEHADTFIHLSKAGGMQPKERTRKDGKPVRQHHARSNSSTLFVFVKPKGSR